MISLCSNFFRPSWRHCLLRVQGINLTKEKRFDKSLFVSFIICVPWAKQSRLFSENNRQRCQNGFPRVQWDFLQRIFFSEKVLFLFQHWALSELFLSFLRKFVGPLVSTVFCLSNGPVCGEKKFVQFFFLHHFWTLIAKWSSFVRIFFGQVDDTAFYGSKGLIWGLKAVLTNFCLFYLSFADLESKNQGFFSENNRQGCQNCSPRVHVDILQGFFFRKVFFYLIIGHWSTFVCHFDEKLSLPLSVLFSVCQLDQFLVKNVCRKILLHHLRTFSKILSVFFRKSFGQLNKTAFHVSRGKIWGQNIVLTKMLFVFFHVLPKLNGEITDFFVKKTIGKFVTFPYHVSKKICWRSFFWKSSFFSSLGIEQLLYVISTKFCQSRCQYCFLLVN